MINFKLKRNYNGNWDAIPTSKKDLHPVLVASITELNASKTNDYHFLLSVDTGETISQPQLEDRIDMFRGISFEDWKAVIIEDKTVTKWLEFSCVFNRFTKQQQDELIAIM